MRQDIVTRALSRNVQSGCDLSRSTTPQPDKWVALQPKNNPVNLNKEQDKNSDMMTISLLPKQQSKDGRQERERRKSKEVINMYLSVRVWVISRARLTNS